VTGSPSEANEECYDTDILDVLSQRVVVGDGAMGTQLQAADPTLDDFNNLAPTRSRRNTFGCNLVNLGDYDFADEIREWALKGTASPKGVVSTGRPYVG
jgi:5-methyltetrahydrofolate--homocysteine methyltransferase